MKVLITGTHFTPAQAVIEELLKQKDLEIVYVGRKTTMEGDKTPSKESQILPELGVKFIPIIAGRLRRHAIDLNSILSFLKIPIGFFQSFWILLNEQPKVILSFGGYISVPLVFWGWFFNIPIILHEQTLVSGLANRISGIFATKIAVSFDPAKIKYDFKKEKIILTGNPIRKELLEVSSQRSVAREFLNKNKNLPLIYITGGNQGSHVINEAVFNGLEDLLELGIVLHQTGDSKFKDFEKLSEKKAVLKKTDRYLPLKWVSGEELSEVFRKADLVISRAGANTLSELAFFSIPTIVIPLPYLYKNEQGKNAKFFSEAGLCETISQESLSSEKLLSKVKEILNNDKKYKESAKKAKELVLLDADKKLSQEVLKFL